MYINFQDVYLHKNANIRLKKRERIKGIIQFVYYIENGKKYSFQYIRKNEKKKITELKGEIFIHDVNVAVMVSLIRLSSG